MLYLQQSRCHRCQVDSAGICSSYTVAAYWICICYTREIYFETNAYLLAAFLCSELEKLGWNEYDFQTNLVPSALADQ